MTENSTKNNHSEINQIGTEASSTATFLNRRNVLRAAALAAAAKVATASAGPANQRSRNLASDPNQNDLPDLPTIDVIALNRMAFGPRLGDFDKFNNLGEDDDERLTAYVDQQLNPSEVDDQACDIILADYDLTTLDLPLETIWRDYVDQETSMMVETARDQPVKDVQTSTLLRAVYSRRQLVEVLADHWHNHFNIYGWDYWTEPFFAHFDQAIIRQHLLGNFREMLEAVAQSPAMLYYLDNQSNAGDDPNENYARELFELHTLGAENYLGVRPLNDPSINARGQRIGYIDEDVYGATVCFTGWHINQETGRFEFNSEKHFPFQKVVLGQTIPSFRGIEDGRDVLDMLVNHPGTAAHVCRRLCRRLISDHPPQRIVDEAAQVFRDNIDAPDQLKQVTRTILLSNEFRNTWGGKVKRPLEYAASLLRAVDADFQADNQFIQQYNNMGQRLFGWHPPDGYPDMKEAWSSTQPTFQRWRMCEALLSRQVENGANRPEDYLLRFDDLMPTELTDPSAVVNWWSQRLLGRELPQRERQLVVEFLAQGRNPIYELSPEDIAQRLRPMVGLIFMSPSFAWR